MTTTQMHTTAPATGPAALSGPALAGPGACARRVRVLVVDDSIVMRRILTRMLTSDPLVEVVGSASDGRDALIQVEKHRPDLVTLDVEMPEMDGLEALRQIQARFPEVRVVMCSSLTRRGAAITIDALLAGASDYVSKQHSAGLTEDAYDVLRGELLGKIRHLFGASRRQPDTLPPSSALSLPKALASLDQKPALRVPAGGKPEILAIGVSTGGPSALAEILPMLPPDFPLPIAIVQHMPPFFTQLLAERLSRLCPIKVVEACPAMTLVPGVAVIAPGDFHMRLVRRGTGVEVRLDQAPRENSCRPAVDVLFRSVAEVYGGRAVALVLTGMGRDGLEGVRPLKAGGASVLVQDSATSVVWGMPGAVAGAALADAILPLKEIIPEVLRRL